MNIATENILYCKFFDHNGQIALSAQWPVHNPSERQFPCFQVYSKMQGAYLDSDFGIGVAKEWCRQIVTNLAEHGFHNVHHRMRLEVYNGTDTLRPNNAPKNDPHTYATHAIAEREQRSTIECLYQEYAARHEVFRLLRQVENVGNESLLRKVDEISTKIDGLMTATGLQVATHATYNDPSTVVFEWSPESNGGNFREAITYPVSADLRLSPFNPIFRSADVFGADGMQDKSTNGQNPQDLTAEARAEDSKIVRGTIVENTNEPNVKYSARQNFHASLHPRSFRLGALQPFHMAAIIVAEEDIALHGVHVWTYNRQESLAHRALRRRLVCPRPVHHSSLASNGRAMTKIGGRFVEVEAPNVGLVLGKLMELVERGDTDGVVGRSAELFPDWEGGRVVDDAMAEF